jgi:hypothetical protein
METSKSDKLNMSYPVIQHAEEREIRKPKRKKVLGGTNIFSSGTTRTA